MWIKTLKGPGLFSPSILYIDSLCTDTFNILNTDNSNVVSVVSLNNLKSFRISATLPSPTFSTDGAHSTDHPSCPWLESGSHILDSISTMQICCQYFAICHQARDLVALRPTSVYGLFVRFNLIGVTFNLRMFPMSSLWGRRKDKFHS